MSEVHKNRAFLKTLSAMISGTKDDDAEDLRERVKDFVNQDHSLTVPEPPPMETSMDRQEPEGSGHERAMSTRGSFKNDKD